MVCVGQLIQFYHVAEPLNRNTNLVAMPHELCEQALEGNTCDNPPHNLVSADSRRLELLPLFRLRRPEEGSGSVGFGRLVWTSRLWDLQLHSVEAGGGQELPSADVELGQRCKDWEELSEGKVGTPRRVQSSVLFCLPKMWAPWTPS